jgi:hypothetical protein
LLAITDGIPGRSWYRTPFWTPGLEDGYGSEWLPLLREACQDGEDGLDRAVEEFMARIRVAAPTVDRMPPSDPHAPDPK